MADLFCVITSLRLLKLPERTSSAIAFSSSTPAASVNRLLRGPTAWSFTGWDGCRPFDQRAIAASWLACRPSGRSPTAETNSPNRKSRLAIFDSPK